MTLATLTAAVLDRNGYAICHENALSITGFLNNGVSERMEDTRGVWLPESTEQGSYPLTETEAASTGSAWVCTRSSLYIV